MKLLETTRTFLEMCSPPRRAIPPPPVAKLEMRRAERPTVSFYRYLYNTIGQYDDHDLCAIIHDPRVKIYIAYVAGVPAGYVELVVRSQGKVEVEIAYIGVIPEFVGRRLGSYLLDWAVSTAWSHKPERVWLDTCTLDHPRALALYKRAGFVPYKQQKETVVPMESLADRR